jgi:3',5'-cyclic AMP phosphodiesterase CpdA
MECMAWAGAGVVWTLSSGVLSSRALADVAGRKARGAGAASREPGGLHFVQISDTHIGFDKAANPDPVATTREAIAKINALAHEPAFLLHTGDLTHAQKPGAFDTISGLLQEAKAGGLFTVPGEHDVFSDGGKEYLERFGRGTLGSGWRSFDHGGAHFVGLVNVLEFKSGKVGTLGAEQLEWLEKDVAGLPASTPVVVFAHIPLWAVYPDWGWVTTDGQQALGYLKRFGSVTVLNGHIHQVMQKVEGNVTLHTAMSTAYPQPAPGVGPGPGPLTVPAEELRRHLGVREVTWSGRPGPLAVVEAPLG